MKKDDYKKLQFETVEIPRVEYLMLKEAYKKYEANNSKSDKIKYLKKTLKLMEINHQKEIDDLNKDIDDLTKTGYKSKEMAIIKDLIFKLSFHHDIFDIFSKILIMHGYQTDDDFKTAMEDLQFIDEKFINLLKQQAKNTDKMAKIDLDAYIHIYKLEQFIEKITRNEEVKYQYTVFKRKTGKEQVVICNSDKELKKKLGLHRNTKLYINENRKGTTYIINKKALLS